MATNLTPKEENITGVDLSGSSGDTGRTYTLANSPFLTSGGITIVVQSTELHEGSGYNINAGLITFLNNVDDSDLIKLNYFTGTLTSQTIIDLLPHEENKTGVDFTGIDGDANRKYSLVNSPFLVSAGISITVQSTELHETSDYTINGQEITLLNNLDNSDLVKFNYFTGTIDDGPTQGLYASTDDVRALVQSTVDFSASTAPTGDDINLFLSMSADEIDQRTQHAWRERTVTEEFYSFPLRSHSGLARGYGGTWNGIPVRIRHRKIKPFDVDEGDKLEIWNGSEYENWLVTRTEGRANDFWLDPEQGVLYVRIWLPFFKENVIRLTYRYGEEMVPFDIRKASGLQAAILVLESDDRSSLLNETGDTKTTAYVDRINNWQKMVDRIIHHRTEMQVVG